MATEGYAALSMRALARASGLKLGALQYHFPTWQALLQALSDYIRETYRQALEQHQREESESAIKAIVRFLYDDPPGVEIHSAELWPQLWAMGLVEPRLRQAVDGIYQDYFENLKQLLLKAGSQTPRIEALMLMSMVEGSAVFIRADSPWRLDSQGFRAELFNWLDQKYQGA